MICFYIILKIISVFCIYLRKRFCNNSTFWRRTKRSGWACCRHGSFSSHIGQKTGCTNNLSFREESIHISCSLIPCYKPVTFKPFILNLISMWGVRLTLAVLLAPRFGLVGVWFAMCAELCTRGALFLLRLARGKWLDKGALA